ncbi:MAG: bifunctional riboflavin kinase/FAD synthetase [Verrucomicrobiae bacterium]|nr:bifunctional riboflavin kinase/FAD synthetase [Verrucomicrobiae bacterium]
MQVFRDLATLGQHYRRVCAAIGVFDGVHRGHQKVIARANATARERDAASVVVTFDPHPARVLQPASAPPLLTSTEHKLRLLSALGVDACMVLTFDRSLAETSAEDFVAQLRRNIPGLERVCVGPNFRFGHQRRGDVELLVELGKELGFVAEEVPGERVGDELVSSTAIRRHVQAGRLDIAAAMLGRPFSILGTVVSGDQLGRHLGYPTANVDPHNEVMPPTGVYVVLAEHAGIRHGGMANIGTRPTVSDATGDLRLEVHLFDFDRELYGDDLEIFFIQRLRDEQRFPSPDALRTQLQADERVARAILRSQQHFTV